ncbi:ADP-ribosyltransferase domain-containing protein [Nocardia sp. NPDC127526]|uniref:WXG100-like domain-containing protein n=1 Tax=Nocardia sp. NPDC127526 TaxID=3345393 RepID=UPI00363EAECE
MSIVIPEELQWVSWIAGSEWPQGDEDKMFELAEVWYAKARDLKALVPDAKDVVRQAEAFYTGDGAVEVRKQLEAMISGDGSLETLADSFTALGDQAKATGTQIEYAKLQIVYTLATLAAQLIEAIATLGATSAEIPAAEAVAQSTVRTIAKKLITAIVEQAAQAAAVEFVIQEYQILRGHRDHIDGKQLGMAVASAAVGAAVTTPIGMGADSLMSKAFGEATSAWSRVGRSFTNGVVTGVAGQGAGYAFNSAVEGEWQEFDPRSLIGVVAPAAIGSIGSIKEPPKTATTGGAEEPSAEAESSSEPQVPEVNAPVEEGVRSSGSNADASEIETTTPETPGHETNTSHDGEAMTEGAGSASASPDEPLASSAESSPGEVDAVSPSVSSSPEPLAQPAEAPEPALGENPSSSGGLASAGPEPAVPASGTANAGGVGATSAAVTTEGSAIRSHVPTVQPEGGAVARGGLTGRPAEFRAQSWPGATTHEVQRPESLVRPASASTNLDSPRTEIRTTPRETMAGHEAAVTGTTEQANVAKGSATARSASDAFGEKSYPDEPAAKRPRVDIAASETASERRTAGSPGAAETRMESSAAKVSEAAVPAGTTSGAATSSRGENGAGPAGKPDASAAGKGSATVRSEAFGEKPQAGELAAKRPRGQAVDPGMPEETRSTAHADARVGTEAAAATGTDSTALAESVKVESKAAEANPPGESREIDSAAQPVTALESLAIPADSTAAPAESEVYSVDEGHRPDDSLVQQEHESLPEQPYSDEDGYSLLGDAASWDDAEPPARPIDEVGWSSEESLVYAEYGGPVDHATSATAVEYPMEREVDAGELGSARAEEFTKLGAGQDDSSTIPADGESGPLAEAAGPDALVSQIERGLTPPHEPASPHGGDPADEHEALVREQENNDHHNVATESMIAESWSTGHQQWISTERAYDDALWNHSGVSRSGLRALGLETAGDHPIVAERGGDLRAWKFTDNEGKLEFAQIDTLVRENKRFLYNALTDSERGALSVYTGPAYTKINAVFTGREVNPTPEIKALVANLESAFAKFHEYNPNTESMTLARGSRVPLEWKGDTAAFLDTVFAPGSRVEIGQVTSFSTSKEVALLYSNPKKGPSYVTVIRTHDGIPAKSFSQAGALDEVIIPPGTCLRSVRVDHRGIGDRPTVYLVADDLITAEEGPAVTHRIAFDQAPSTAIPQFDHTFPPASLNADQCASVSRSGLRAWGAETTEDYPILAERGDDLRAWEFTDEGGELQLSDLTTSAEANQAFLDDVLTDSERESVRRYAEAGQVSGGLESAFAKFHEHSQNLEPMTVMSSAAVPRGWEYEEFFDAVFAPGSRVEIADVTAFSTDPEVAQRYADHAESPYLMVVRTRDGLPLLGFGDNNEVIIPPGTHLRCVMVDYEGVDDMTTVYLVAEDLVANDWDSRAAQ